MADNLKETKKLGVSRDELRQAVAMAGSSMVKDVQRYLGR